MSATLYLEGGATGPDSKYSQIRCREGFRRLLEKCDFTGRMPRLFACGGRDSVFHDFKIALRRKAAADYVAMLIDSEDPVTDREAAWQHLAVRDKWRQPAGTTDDQVMFMTTCMETWMIADREALRKHYGSRLQLSALPSLTDLEGRDRHQIQDALARATRNCSNAYRKGGRSYQLLVELTPTVLEEHLPSFERALRILNDRL